MIDIIMRNNHNFRCNELCQVLFPNMRNGSLQSSLKDQNVNLICIEKFPVVLEWISVGKVRSKNPILFEFFLVKLMRSQLKLLRLQNANIEVNNLIIDPIGSKSSQKILSTQIDILELNNLLIDLIKLEQLNLLKVFQILRKIVFIQLIVLL